MYTPTVVVEHEEEIDYPESDGLPIADNTKQFQWITVLVWNLDLMFKDDPNVFVAGDLLWYPVKGRNTLRRAPDAMTVHGRPKGHRRSYKQWEEGGIPPQVVFEVLSQSNTAWEMRQKRDFYDQYGSEEFYVYDPDKNELQGWVRSYKGTLDEIVDMHKWTSPRLKIEFLLTPDDLHIYTPQGERFLTFAELDELRQHERTERIRAEQEALKALQREKQAMQREKQAMQRAEKMAEQLRKLGIDPDA